MLRHRLTRGELLLVLGAILMIGAVAIGTGQRQAVLRTAEAPGTCPTEAAILATTNDQCPMEQTLAGVNAPDAECALKDATLAGAPGETCDPAKLAAGECDKTQCEAAKATLAAAEAGKEAACDTARPVKDAPVEAVQVAAKSAPKESGQ